MPRRPSKILELMRSEKVSDYETTLDDCFYWFNIINEEIFSKKLSAVEIVIKRLRGAYAYYQHSKKLGHSKIVIHRKFADKQLFVSCLAHEMVHHYQFLNNQPMGHGPSFEIWADKFHKKGLELAYYYGKE